jgi:cysteine desulfuration protein SufE
MAPMPPRLQEQLDNLALFPDRQDRIEALISLGDEFRSKPRADVPRDDAHRVPACESEVFIDSLPLATGRQYRFAVDNPQGISAMAMAQILDEGLSGEDPNLVRQVPDDIIYTIFGRELSMGKSAGLMGMVQKVKMEALKALV